MTLSDVLAGLPQNTWNAKCLARLPRTVNGTFVDDLIEFVDMYGRQVGGFVNESWGITIESCYRYCGLEAIPYSFDFQTFASAFSNYLLPWLALTAQLPYETCSSWDDMLSLCISVGSPAMITYSLALTILNRYSLRTRWHSLHTTASSREVYDRYNDFGVRVKAIQYLLQEAQQVPMRASQEKGWLSSLIVGPKNQVWWRNLQSNLKRTRRGVTFSLVAQILAAGVAWLFTVSSIFLKSRGDRIVANHLSSGIMWLWLVPVICGWITVGTQNRSGSIEEALRVDIAYRAKSGFSDGSITEKKQQRGIMVRSGLAIQPHHAQTNEAAFEVPPLVNLELPHWLGADIMGDEKREGPIFNYARVFTWWRLAHTMEKALQTTVNAIATGEACRPRGEKLQPWSQDRREENLAGDSHTTAHYCGLDLKRGQILAYPEWSEITADVWKRMVVASAVALFVQWGTTGPGLVIAYFTTTKGIGCRFAGYLLYGGLATLVWALLTASMLFSHAALLIYQREHRETPSMDFRKASVVQSPLPVQTRASQGYERSNMHSVLCGFAVVTRLLGKTIAVVNAMWIVTSSLLEYTGVYDRCYCRGNQIGMGMDGGWLVLFKTESELAQYATTPWAGGVAISIIVCFTSYFFFWLGSRRSARGQ